MEKSAREPWARFCALGRPLSKLAYARAEYIMKKMGYAAKRELRGKLPRFGG
jgi:hypothetical protein